MRAKDAYDNVASDRGPAVRVEKVFEEQCRRITNPVKPNFIQRQLAASALGEVLFVLIMVLTITLTAKLTTADDREGVTIFLGS